VLETRLLTRRLDIPVLAVTPDPSFVAPAVGLPSPA